MLGVGSGTAIVGMGLLNRWVVAHVRSMLTFSSVAMIFSSSSHACAIYGYYLLRSYSVAIQYTRYF